MSVFFESELFIITLNIGAYVFSGLIMKALNIRFMNALLPAIAIVVAVLILLDIDYSTYEQNSRFISFFLGPSVVALGYILHKQVDSIKGNVLPILISVTVGAVVNLLFVNLIFMLFDTDKSIIYSIQPKSVTTPIALSISEQNGGIASLTVIIVVFTGILGSIIGAPLLKLCKITNPISKGLALGASAHAIGTARAAELGAKEGAMGGLAIGLMGVITALILSAFKDLLL